MLIIQRDIASRKSKTNSGNLFPHCQASFNSDGQITLRNYDDNSSDEIIILSNKETNAIFSLFSRIGQKNKNFDLPF